MAGPGFWVRVAPPSDGPPVAVDVPQLKARWRGYALLGARFKLEADSLGKPVPAIVRRLMAFDSSITFGDIVDAARELGCEPVVLFAALHTSGS